MRNNKYIVILVTCVCIILTACNLPLSQEPISQNPTTEAPTQTSSEPTATLTPSEPINICLGQEPRSLFLYDDISKEADLVRQAIYDGPYDDYQGEYSAVILEKIPSYNDGDVFFEPAEVAPGAMLVDAWGNLVKLETDVAYFPSGCQDFSCVQTYAGAETVIVDRQVVRFSLKPGVLWSDGKEVSADDSLFSFEIVRQIYPRAGADSLPFTASYQTIDAYTLEWRGVPAYRSGEYMKFFFHPLPRHVSAEMTVEELFASQEIARSPIGWGPFVIDEWQPGVNIVLKKNQNYFRANEGLPKAESLTFKFIPDKDEAIAALLSGECDILSPTYGLEQYAEQLQALEQNPEVRLEFFDKAEWEHLDFGVAPISPEVAPLFQSKLTRQAIAMCIDRQQIGSEVTYAASSVPHSFVAESHTNYHSGVRAYGYDPAAAAALLDAAGWIDDDADPATARTSLGVTGVADGTPFAFTMLTTPDEDRQKVAQTIQTMLAQCGVMVQVEAYPPEQLFQPGPDGLLFGRQFHSALFSWAGEGRQVCKFFTSQEIPGDYPQFIKGWGGANLSGYSNAEFDQACSLSLRALPGTPDYVNSFALAQSIFSEDLPAIPLFFRKNVAAKRIDICEPLTDSDAGLTLWNLELLNTFEHCEP